MISPEIIRRYPFFAGLNHDQLVTLAKIGEELNVATDYIFFQENDYLETFYLIIKGSISIFVSVPDGNITHGISQQLTGELVTEDVIVSAVGSGDIFGWSALIEPYTASAGAKALTPCHVIAFHTQTLHDKFKEQPAFGYLISQKAGHVIRERLRDLRIESLAALYSHP